MMPSARRALSRPSTGPVGRFAWLNSTPEESVRALGAALVTGADDDDPSGNATYSQIGAQFGFSMLWILVLAFPLMAAIQEASAWIGGVSGRGLARNTDFTIRRLSPTQSWGFCFSRP